MRRSYISPEWSKVETWGSLNTFEESSFFGAKMIEIDDSITISNENIVSYMRKNGEQIDINSESILEPIVYQSSKSKYELSKLIIDDRQSDWDKENSTKWLLTIDYKNLLTEYIYAQVRKWRTFEGIRVYMTLNNNVSLMIKEYIRNNVLDRYEIERVDLYIEYVDLRNQNVLRYKNTWDESVMKESNLNKKTQMDFVGDHSLNISFKQELPSKLNNFKYYYNILYKKI